MADPVLRLPILGAVRIPGAEAAANLDRAGGRRFPGRDDPRYREPLLYPDLAPTFHLEPGQTVFTIGSCFARNIEEHLHGFHIPTLGYGVPESEWAGARRNGILNEYNPGSISQRIERAMRGEPSPEGAIVRANDLAVDLLLSGYPVTRERAVARQKEIDGIYAELPSADVLVVTLGLVEAWFDAELGVYLNRIPQRDDLHSGRYELVVFDPAEALAVLEPAFRLLGGKRVILTVSPVPLAATFTGHDTVTANGYSKAVLRVCAEQLARLPGVDYLPSYEIVVAGGTPAFEDDNIHVLDSVVAEIVRYMLDAYVEPTPRSADDGD